VSEPEGPILAHGEYWAMPVGAVTFSGSIQFAPAGQQRLQVRAE
jgi:hypothetical protein